MQLKFYYPYATTLILMFIGCSSQRTETPAVPQIVTVASCREAEVAEHMTFVGTLTSNFDAVIQPRINGFLSLKSFQSGMPVKKGELLFNIDPAQFSSQVLEAEAQLQSSQAQAIEAKNNYHRAVPLARINAISQSQLDQYTAQYRAAEAAGCNAHVGDYVGPQTEFNVLTTISNIDTLSVSIAIPMSRYIAITRLRDSTYDNHTLLKNITLTLADGSTYPYKGSYDYTQKDVDASTGTLNVVVDFPNPEKRLKAGQFARVEAEIGAPQKVILIPQSAVNQLQNINSVWVVEPDDRVRFREISLGEKQGTLWRITGGLEVNERVVTAGGRHLKNGDKVVIK